MGFRFRYSKKLMPGVRLNVGKEECASVRLGGRGFGVTTGTSGRRVTAGIPGTGLSYTSAIKSGQPDAGSTVFAVFMITVLVFTALIVMACVLVGLSGA